MPQIDVTYYADPACPWAYSALPAVTTLRWRYGDALRWRLVTIGLSESAEYYEGRGYGPARMAQAPLRFGRFGMPFAIGPRRRVISSGRACRAVVAARLQDDELAYLALRALHFAWFTTDLLLDEDEAIADALGREPRLDAETIVARLDDPEVEEAYQRDRSEARSIPTAAAILQGKTANNDGVERYTAPTLVFETNGTRLEAGGHQPVEAYDVLIANLDSSLARTPPAADARKAVTAFPHALATREVAQVMAGTNDQPDDRAALAELLELAGAGEVTREPLGGDALWRDGRNGP